MSTEKVTAEQLETGSVPPAEKKSFIRKVRDYLKWYHYLAGFLLFVLGFMLITYVSNALLINASVANVK